MIEIKSIKFVKKAGCWCLSYSIIKDKKEIQKQEWWNTLARANQRVAELKKGEQKEI